MDKIKHKPKYVERWANRGNVPKFEKKGYVRASDKETREAMSSSMRGSMGHGSEMILMKKEVPS